ncbi:hypothetical protein FQN50_004301 [Emmonsiellopsis sp. PD_5]|nr:hypothetical protein FQN50_004301 [Emmonsiellopsis sp. PD_5]
MGDTGRKRASPERDISPPPLKRKAVKTTTTTTTTTTTAITTHKTAPSNFFTPLSRKKPEQIGWRVVHNSCVIGRYGKDKSTLKLGPTIGSRRRVAAFDLDHTVIVPLSGNRFPRDQNDWKWWRPEVPKKLKDLYDDGYLVVVVSNQGGISLKKEIKGGRSEAKSLNTFKQKVAAVMKSLDIPISVYAATEHDEYRKPRMGMWKEMLEDYDLDVDGAVDLERSIFVGDAAGREGDHSCADRYRTSDVPTLIPLWHSDILNRDFAANVGIPFKTPEEFFLDESPRPISRDFDPKSYIITASDDESKISFSKQNAVELVIFCGSPSAGKSTFYWKYLEPLGYERVNQDILKNRQKCLKVADEFLEAGKSVAVDNTNADPETRAHWINLAKSHKVPIRCIYLSTPAKICKHNNAVRAANSKIESINPEMRPLLPGIAFGDFARRFKEPALSEGFQDITHVEFKFQGTPAASEVWGQYWV